MSLDAELREKFHTYAEAAPTSAGLLDAVLQRSRRRRQRRLVGVAGLALILVASAAVARPLLRPAPDAGVGVEAPTPDSHHVFERCLMDKGWKVTIESDEATSIDTPYERYKQFMVDSKACRQQAGIADPGMALQYAEPWADAQLAEYDCVVAAGYQPAPPPSRQEMIDELLEYGTTSWDPIADVLSRVFGQASFADIQRALAPCNKTSGLRVS